MSGPSLPIGNAMRVALFFTALLSAFALSFGVAHAETPGLAYVEDTTFTVLDDSVQVSMRASMTNTTEERRSGDTVYFSYFDTFIFVIPQGVDDLSVTSGGASLRWTAEDLDEDFMIVTAEIPVQLRSGQTRDFAVQYTLPRGEIRTQAAFFSNPAFHGFPLWSFSDPGTGSLTLRVPVGAEMSELGTSLAESGRDDEFVEWSPVEFATPEDFFTYVNVTREDRLEETAFEVEGQQIIVRSWPGDVEWATFAQTTIERGLPRLQDLIGLPIPDQDTLEVTESVNPHLFGYAGWYDPNETSIEVGSALDQSVMLHELSHAWFNQDLFIDRWVSEGLAEELAWQAQRSLDWEDGELPTTPRSTDAGATPLVTWGDPVANLGNEALRERETYGYNASWYVIRELTTIIGVDGLQDVLAAAEGNAPSYPGVNPNETTGLRDDWRRLIDLASLEVAPEDEPLIDQLFLDVVVDERRASALEIRRLARDRYQRFVDRELAWNVPDELRQAMTEWRFEDARQILDRANRVLDLQRRVMDQAGLAGLEADEAARAPYEQVPPDYEGALEILEAQDAAIASVQSVRRLADQPLSQAERWGFENPDLGVYARAAEVSYTANDFAAIAGIEERLRQDRVAAAQAGARRLTWSRIGLGGAILAVLQGIAIVWRARPSGDPVEEAAEDDANTPDVDGQSGFGGPEDVASLPAAA